MKIKAKIHQTESGSYWAEIPAIPGCTATGETFEELLEHIYEAVEKYLSADIESTETTDKDPIMEIGMILERNGWIWYCNTQ
ncbi:MAG TPA: type II toxin-antitoxin system HicB family antitoxin [Candidatus Obscuribacterales bacterium]